VNEHNCDPLSVRDSIRTLEDECRRFVISPRTSVGTAVAMVTPWTDYLYQNVDIDPQDGA